MDYTYQTSDMEPDTSTRLRAIADARDIPASEIFEEALERGLEALWEDVVLEEYFDGECSRAEAIDIVGLSTLERAERERDFIESTNGNREEQ